MALTIKQGRLTTLKDYAGGIDGASATYYIGGLELADTHTTINNNLKQFLIDNGQFDEFGQPLANIQIRKFAGTQAIARVQWGRGGGGGGGSWPVDYSGTDSPTTQWINVPVYKTQWDLGSQEYERRRVDGVTIPRYKQRWYFNSRIQENFMPWARFVAQRESGKSLTINGTRLVVEGATFKRYRTNEIRGQLNLWTNSAVPDLTLAVEAAITIPPLLPLQEWVEVPGALVGADNRILTTNIDSMYPQANGGDLGNIWDLEG